MTHITRYSYYHITAHQQWFVHHLCRVSSPPPLDWPLPSQFEQCELKLEVQPRSYHRAHYETEGSRGAIKAAPGGHPVVKVSRCLVILTRRLKSPLLL